MGKAGAKKKQKKGAAADKEESGDEEAEPESEQHSEEEEQEEPSSQEEEEVSWGPCLCREALLVTGRPQGLIAAQSVAAVFMCLLMVCTVLLLKRVKKLAVRGAG